LLCTRNKYFAVPKRLLIFLLFVVTPDAKTQSGDLTLCPSDVVTTSGENVFMPVAGKPDSSFRWYRHVNSTYKVVIYTGKRMDYKQVYILKISC